VRRKSPKRVGGGSGPERPDLRRLLEEESALVRRITTHLLSRYRLAPGESRALRRLIRARLTADDYGALRAFNGRSSFATYLVVVIVGLVRELTDGWRVPEAPSAEMEPTREPAPPRAALTVALANVRALPPRDRILLKLRFAEQLPLSSLTGALALDRAALRRRLGELRRALLRDLTKSGCEDRHSASLFAAATRQNLHSEGEPAISRPSNGVGELDADDPVDDQVPS
jgi:hypothetical protein